jgi:hypothetical protein
VFVGIGGGRREAARVREGEVAKVVSMWVEKEGIPVPRLRFRGVEEKRERTSHADQDERRTKARAEGLATSIGAHATTEHRDIIPGAAKRTPSPTLRPSRVQLGCALPRADPPH